MNEYKQTAICYECKKQILHNIYYCCNIKQYYCYNCSNQKCTNCHKYKNINQIQNKRKQCYGCKNYSFQSIMFNQCNCKYYYCTRCIFIYYDKHKTTTQDLKQYTRNQIQLKVQLICKCQINNNIIYDYSRKYCYYCTNKLNYSGVKIQNQLYIHILCYNNHRYQINFNRQYYSNPYCSGCDQIIDGTFIKYGKHDQNTYFCRTCVQNQTPTFIAFRTPQYYHQKIYKAYEQRGQIMKQLKQKQKLYSMIRYIGFGRVGCGHCYNCRSGVGHQYAVLVHNNQFDSARLQSYKSIQKSIEQHSKINDISTRQSDTYDIIQTSDNEIDDKQQQQQQIQFNLKISNKYNNKSINKCIICSIIIQSNDLFQIDVTNKQKIKINQNNHIANKNNISSYCKLCYIKSKLLKFSQNKITNNYHPSNPSSYPLGVPSNTSNTSIYPSSSSNSAANKKIFKKSNLDQSHKCFKCKQRYADSYFTKSSINCDKCQNNN